MASQRIQALQKSLCDKGLDVALIYDRENLIYFANITDLEGGCLIVPATGAPRLLCLWLDARHVRDTSGIDDVVPYFFPGENVSQKAAEYVQSMGIKAPKIGFTRYFIGLKDYQMLQKFVPAMQVADIAETCYRIRSVKDAGELEKIKKAADFVSLGMETAVAYVKAGVKESDVLAEADYAMKKAGSEGSSFRMQVLTHERQQLVHPYAGTYTLAPDRPVVIHLGASFEGYTAKMCRTVFLGDAPQQSKCIYETLVKAQKIAFEAVKPGVTSADVYDAVYAYLETMNYERQFMDHIGYGVGIRQSEFYPILGKGIDHQLEVGMVIDLLLPTLYVPDFGGPRITDTVLITENGCDLLTQYTDEVICKPNV